MTPLCLLCGHALHPTDIRTCLPCLGRVRRRLHTIAELYSLLPAMLGQPVTPGPGTVMGLGGDEPPLPGGVALAMLGPGAPSGEGRPDDPPAVRCELAGWVRDWAEVRGETLLPQPAVLLLTRWLSQRAGWAAAQHDAFDEFTADLHRIGGWLEAVTGVHDRPETGAPCFGCGADLERRWTDAGLADDWVCPRCAKVYPPAHYALAVRAQYEQVTG